MIQNGTGETGSRRWRAVLPSHTRIERHAKTTGLGLIEDSLSDFALANLAPLPVLPTDMLIQGARATRTL